MSDAPTNTPPTSKPAEEHKHKSCCNLDKADLFQGAIWWAMLVVAVIAIPAFSFAISLALGVGQTAQMIVFMVTCWLCTWLGMWLMKKARS